MADNKKISELTELAETPATSDALAIVDASASETKRISYANLFSGHDIGSDVQAYSALLDAIAALTPTDSNIIVGNGTTWVAESGSTARTSLGVDAAGTDNSTNVTLAGTPDYITISGQVITRNAIDLAADVTGDLPVAEGGTGASTAADARTNLGVDEAGHLTDNNGAVVITGNEGNVGIGGDFAPSFSLTGTGLQVRTNKAIVQVESTGAGQSAAFVFAGDAASYHFVSNSSGNFVISETTVADRILLEQTTGYFGVGTAPTTRLHAEGSIRTAQTAVASMPSASTEGAGSVRYCTNGDAGSPCLAVSNGTNWLRVALGAAISAT